MSFFSWLFGNKKKEKMEKRNILTLQIDDSVVYDDETFLVIGKITYNDSGYKWYGYHLKGHKRNLWLSASLEEDVKDGIEIGMYEKVAQEVTLPIPKKVSVENVTYFLEEKGKARFTHNKGKLGGVETGVVEYWDYESDDDTIYPYVSIEKWGDFIEISKGYDVYEHELKFKAAVTE